VLQHGAGGQTGGWLNASADVQGALDEVQSEEQPRVIPVPWVGWLLDERFERVPPNLTPARGDLPAGTRGGSYGAGAWGIYGRALTFGGAAQVQFPASVPQALAGARGVTVLAWVRRGATGAAHRVLDWDIGGATSKLRLGVDAAGTVSFSLRPVLAEVIQTSTSVATLTDLVGWHLVGGFADVPGDVIGTVLDGTILSGVVAFTAQEIGAEGGASSYLGLSVLGLLRWVGEIASVLVWDRRLSPGEILAVYRQGQRGVLA
jgi:hypothetical protein